jgi:uncharacterized membrane protein
MIENSPTCRRLSIVIVFISVLIGGWLRLSDLGAKSISHPEMYVPGIRLPAGVAEPSERLTLVSVVTGTFSSDTHPPGYYIAMLPWTHAFGTSLRSLRLPSALLGLACIPLLYWLGVLMGSPLSGALAAALLALSGYHVFWTRVARMFALECFLGLAATVVLLLIVTRGRARGFLAAVYVALVLAGVATDVYFWSLLAAHMVWTFGNAIGKRELSAVCRAQLLALVLGSPLIAFAAYQSGNTVADLSRNVPRYLAEFSAFAFAIPSDVSGFFPAAVPFTGFIAGWMLRILILAIAIVLLISGFRRAWRPSSMIRVADVPSTGRQFWTWSWMIAGMIGTLEICGFVYATRWLPPEQVKSTLKATEFLTVLPIALAILALLVDRYWASLRPQEGRKQFKVPLAALLAIIPFGLLAMLSQARPILNQRGLLFASPYLFFILAYGLLALRSKVWTTAIILTLVPICVLSLRSYSRMTMDPADYGHFAASITTEIQSSDLVFVRKAWYATPILYYLNADQFHIVGRNYSAASAKEPSARVWVVLLYDPAPSAEMLEGLTGYHKVRTIAAPQAEAILYQRGSESASAQTLKRPKPSETIGN